MPDKPAPDERNVARGKATPKKADIEVYREMGRKGGAVSRERGTDFVELGRRGGEATKASHDKDHFAQIGKRGGQNGKGTRKPGSGRRKLPPAS